MAGLIEWRKTSEASTFVRESGCAVHGEGRERMVLLARIRVDGLKPPG